MNCLMDLHNSMKDDRHSGRTGKMLRRMLFGVMLGPGLGLGLLAGCAAVQPHEREYLADPIMLQEEASEGAYEQHLHRALSQGLAGQPAAGGGCGCEQ